MLRLTVLLCSGLFLVMLLGGRDFGQLRPGLAVAAAEAKAVPVAVVVPAVETAALAPDVAAVVPDMAMPVVVAPVVAAVVVPAVVAPVVANPVVVAVAPAPVVEPAGTGVFTLATYADAPVATATPEASADGEIWYVAGNSLNVRSGPSTDDAVVGKLTRGEAMLVVAREGDEWARIKIEGDGIEGYVATRFLSAEVPVIN